MTSSEIPNLHPVDQEENANPAKSNAILKVGNAGEDNSREDQILNIQEPNVVMRENGTPVSFVASPNNDHNRPPYNLCKIALSFFAQLVAVFVGNVINKSPPTLCSRSHSSDYNWAAVTVAAIILVGFVVTLISVASTKKNATISSATAKFGLAAVASVVIISFSMTLPLDARGKITLSVAACLAALAAIALAFESRN